MTTVIPVILCGGSGTRLWPLSRTSFPKQFLALSNSSKQSLFQMAVERVNSPLIAEQKIGPTLVVTNEEHRFLALEQLRELRNIKSNLLLEPIGRNTAPALTMGALAAQDISNDPILLVVPADQTILDEDTFSKAISKCIQIVEGDQNNLTIAILGITPTSPEIGYGYIKRDQEKSDHDGYIVEQFTEKPDFATAQSYLKDGYHFWNSGVFVMRASTWLAALTEFRPDIFNSTQIAWNGKSEDHASIGAFIRPSAAEFQAIPSESIDYAVIEKCPGSRFAIKMVELNAGWNDLGAWEAIWQVNAQDAQGNVATGDTLVSDTSDTLIHASNRLVSTVGVNNLVIVETADAVLVADRSKSQDVKNIVAQLEKQQRPETNLHRKVSRPWGWYDSIDEGDRFKVKRIQVKPGASLSLQKHAHRAEHWVVVKGTAQITNGDQTITLTENQSTYIPQGQIHRLSNPSTEPLEIIEVQSGSYLGEDDIERFEDHYGRS
jgi:mannose-1-phosphate guanylyltransferase/mannose-6-phosphate isomerase